MSVDHASNVKAVWIVEFGRIVVRGANEKRDFFAGRDRLTVNLDRPRGRSGHVLGWAAKTQRLFYRGGNEPRIGHDPGALLGMPGELVSRCAHTELTSQTHQRNVYPVLRPILSQRRIFLPDA